MKGFDLPSYPAYAHQFEALQRRMRREDLEAVGAHLGRVRIVLIRDPQTSGRAGRGTKVILNHLAATSSGGQAIDFSALSPLSAKPRQGGATRIPHFSITRVSRVVVPRAADGRTHPRYPDRSSVAGDHHDYVVRGGEATIRDHHAYITRVTAVEADGVTQLIDLLDTRDDCRLQNHLAIYSNIPGGRGRERSLFEAAERTERRAKGGSLRISTEHVTVWTDLALKPGAPPWVKDAAKKLRESAAERDAKVQCGEAVAGHHMVDLEKVDLETAFEQLTWCDEQFELLAGGKPDWRSGPCGRVQTRFVAELPRGLSPYERRAILEQYCDRLSDAGWMVVGAIHRPDAHNDPNNYHIHIDGYDRPSTWMEEYGCWDFEVRVRKRNGKFSYPHRQQKIAAAARSETREDGTRAGQLQHGREYLKAERAAYIQIVNEVADGREGVPNYLAGTYKDANIRLTPTRHLGGSTIAAEAAGVRTEAGSRNAQILLADELRCIADQLEFDLLRNSMRVLGAMNNLLTPAIRAVADEWQRLQDEITTRQADASVLQVLASALTSRATAMLRANTAGKADLIQAREWIDEIDALLPDERARAREAGKVARLNEAAVERWSELETLVAGQPRRLRYIVQPGSPSTSMTPVPAAFREQITRRLEQWLDKNGRDPRRLRFVDDGFVVAATEPKSVHRLFKLLGDDETIQRLLLRERRRRREIEARARMIGFSTADGVEFGQEWRGVAEDNTGPTESRVDHLVSTPALADVPMLSQMASLQRRKRRRFMPERGSAITTADGDRFADHDPASSVSKDLPAKAAAGGSGSTATPLVAIETPPGHTPPEPKLGSVDVAREAARHRTVKPRQVSSGLKVGPAASAPRPVAAATSRAKTLPASAEPIAAAGEKDAPSIRREATKPVRGALSPLQEAAIAAGADRAAKQTPTTTGGKGPAGLRHENPRTRESDGRE